MKKINYQINLSNEAESDFANSYAFYKSESQAIADKFIKSIDQSFRKIAFSPYSYNKVFKSLRRHLVKKFPFVIYYYIDEYNIKIVAIFHTSRNPEIWNNRLNSKGSKLI